MRTVWIFFIVAFFSTLSFAQCFSKFIVLGDSLSDTVGASFWSRLLHEKSDSLPVAPRPGIYFEGRFSNGPIWVDFLADHLKISKKQPSAYNTPRYDKNFLESYAFGGAWAVSNSRSIFSPPLEVQVTTYLTQHHADLDKSQHLISMWIGANDYLSRYYLGVKAVEGTINGIQYQLERLIHNGVRCFIVPNMPDLGKTPKAKRLHIEQTLSDISIQHNTRLKVMLAALKKTYPDLKVIEFDVYTALNDVILALFDNPYFFTHFEEACYTGSYFAESNVFSEYSLCSDPEHYIFWDSVHPTTRIHKIFSEYLQRKLRQVDFIKV